MHLSRILFLFALISVSLSPLAVESADQPTVESADHPSIEEVEKKLAKLEAKQTDDPKQAKLIELYQSALGNLQSAESNKEKVEELKSLQLRSQKNMDSLVGELAAHRKRSKSDIQLPVNISLSKLDSVLLEKQQLLKQLTDRQRRLSDQITKLQARPAIVREELQASNTALKELISESETLASDNQAMTTASTFVKRSKRTRLTAIINRLETENRTHTDRLALRQMQYDIATLESKRASSEVNALLSLEKLQRINAARELQNKVSETQNASETEFAPDRLKRFQARNLAMSEEHLDIVTRSERISDQRIKIESQLTELNNAYNTTKQQLAIAELGVAMGPALLEQNRYLSTLQRPKKDVRTLSKQLANTKLRSFQLNQDLRAEAEKYDALVEAIEQETELSPSQRKQLTAHAGRLVNQYHNILVATIKSYDSYAQEIAVLDIAYDNIENQAEKFDLLLDKHLIWIPTHPQLTVARFSQWAGHVTQFFSANLWKQHLEGIARGTVKHWPWSALLLVLFLIYWRVRLPARERLMARSLAKVGPRSYHFSMALEALALHVIGSLALPILMVYIGWLSTTIPDDQLAKPFALACYLTAIALATLTFARRVFSRSGLGPLHLRWKKAPADRISRSLLLASYLAVPITFFLTFANHIPPAYAEQPLYRPLFIALSAIVLFFSILLYKQSHGVFGRSLFTIEHAYFETIWKFAWGSLVVAQLVAIVLSITGYHFSAQAVERRLLFSVIAIFGFKLIHDLFVLWFMLSSARWQALQKEVQAELDAEKEQHESSGVLDEDHWAAISSKAIQLLHVGLFAAFVLVISVIWWNFIPALTVFDKFELWSYSVSIDGVDTLRYVSLLDLGVASLVFLLTYFVATGLPAVIELLAPQHMQAEGVGFALKTITRYMILVMGIIIGFQMLGVGWNKVQWLAAGFSVGLGFGLQEIFANLMSGLIILFERPVRIGDYVTIGDLSGTITRIRMRATTIVDFDNKELIVPNKIFISEKLVNWTLSSPIVRLVLEVGVSYKADTDATYRTLMRILEENQNILDDPEASVIFRSFGDSALIFQIRAFLDDTDLRFQVLHELHMEITRAFRDQEIEIAYPQLDVHLKDGFVMPQETR